MFKMPVLIVIENPLTKTVAFLYIMLKYKIKFLYK